MKRSLIGTVRRLLLLTTLLLPATLGAGPASSRAGGEEEMRRNADGYADLTVEQLARMFARKTFTLVNVHVPYEGEIDGTDLFIPFDRIGGNLDRLPGKDEPIVLYCRSGAMSASAARVLAARGYTRVMELDGGFNAWKRAGHPLVDRR